MTRRFAKIIGVSPIVAMTLAYTLVSAQGEPPPETNDASLLMRDAQLADWLGVPLPPATSVCIQERLTVDWPRPRGGALSEREEDRLRLLHESCAAPASASGDAGRDRGLVVSARNDFLERVERLSGLHKAVRACASSSSDNIPQATCLARVVVQPLTQDEARRLLAASAVQIKPPASPH